MRWEILHVDDKKLPYFIDKNDILLLSEQVIFSRGMHLFTSESHNSTGDGRFDFHFITTFSFLASRISKPDGMYPKLLNIYSFIIFVNSVVIKFQWHSIFHVDFYGAADTKNIISDRRVEHFALNIFISQNHIYSTFISDNIRVTFGSDCIAAHTNAKIVCIPSALADFLFEKPILAAEKT